MKTVIRKGANKVSLARALSKLGYCSRAQAVGFIAEGKVLVNGKVVNDAQYWCDLKRDTISLKSDVGVRRLKKAERIYIVMNKPKGVVTTRSDELSRGTVYDLLKSVDEWVFPVGRLDKDTSGLLLFTNDTQLGDELTSPAAKVPKTYRVLVNKRVAEEHVFVMRAGMELDGDVLLPASIVTTSGECEYDITIVEGKNRQVRRMFEAFGYRVLALSRIRIGGFEDNRLEKGKWRVVSKGEVELMRGR